MSLGKVLILGHGRHGKDTVAELLEKHAKLKFQSSSEAALDVIWPVLKSMRCWDTQKKAFEERHSHRALWKELITLYNTSDKSALCRKILEQSDVYVGMRCVHEYNASKYLFDTVLWVHAFDRHGGDSSMTIPCEDHMIAIDNNGTLDELEQQIVEYLNDKATKSRMVQTARKESNRFPCRSHSRP